jgi:hypothetical protein
LDFLCVSRPISESPSESVQVRRLLGGHATEGDEARSDGDFTWFGVSQGKWLATIATSPKRKYCATRSIEYGDVVIASQQSRRLGCVATRGLENNTHLRKSACKLVIAEIKKWAFIPDR